MGLHTCATCNTPFRSPQAKGLMTRLRPIIQASLGADRRSKNRGTNIGSAVVIGVLSTGCPHLLINEREREGCVDGARRGKRWWKKTSRGPRDWKKRDKIAGNELAVCPTYLTVLLTSDLGLLGRERSLRALLHAFSTRARRALGLEKPRTVKRICPLLFIIFRVSLFAPSFWQRSGAVFTLIAD